MRLQGVLGDWAEHSAGSAQVVEPLGAAAPAAPSVPSSFTAAEAPAQARSPANEVVDDWPILREGEGGKLASNCTEHVHGFMASRLLRLDMEAMAHDANQ